MNRLFLTTPKLALLILCWLMSSCGGVDERPKRKRVKRQDHFKVHLISRYIFQSKALRFSRLKGDRAFYMSNVQEGKIWRFELDDLSKRRREGKYTYTDIHRSILKQSDRYYPVLGMDQLLIGKKKKRAKLIIGSESLIERCCQLKTLSPSSKGPFYTEKKYRTTQAAGGL